MGHVDEEEIMENTNEILHMHSHHDGVTQPHPEDFPKIQDFEITSALFKNLSDPLRIKIFWILCHYEECVTNIAALVDMSSPAVAHHLRLLKDSKLVVSRKVGKEVHYKAADNEAAQALHLMIEQMMEISCPKKS